MFYKDIELNDQGLISMHKAIQWTDETIERMVEMRSRDMSFEDIANSLGIAARETVRRKYNDIQKEKACISKPKTQTNALENKAVKKTKKKREAWSEKDLQTLKEGYSKEECGANIIARLEVKRSLHAVHSKASSLGITKPINEAHQTSEDNDLFKLYLSGITPYEAAIISSNRTENIKKVFEGFGWKERANKPHKRISLRREIVEETQAILKEDIDREDPNHLMALLAVAADRCHRDIPEIARICILPLVWVERIFGRLDSMGVWPVTDKRRTDLQSSDYEIFAEICREEYPFLKDILHRG